MSVTIPEQLQAALEGACRIDPELARGGMTGHRPPCTESKWAPDLRPLTDFDPDVR